MNTSHTHRLATGRRARRALLALTVGALILGVSATAMAQRNDEQLQQLVSVGGLSTTSPFLITSTSADRGMKKEIEEMKEEEKKLRRYVMLEQYLRGDRATLRDAVALGGGKGLRDLAAIFRVRTRDLRTQGRALRANRAALLKLLDQPLSRDLIVALHDALEPALLGTPEQAVARRATRARTTGDQTTTRGGAR